MVFVHSECYTCFACGPMIYECIWHMCDKEAIPNSHIMYNILYVTWISKSCTNTNTLYVETTKTILTDREILYFTYLPEDQISFHLFLSSKLYHCIIIRTCFYPENDYFACYSIQKPKKEIQIQTFLIGLNTPANSIRMLDLSMRNF